MSWAQNGMIGDRGDDSVPDVFEPIIGFRQFHAVRKPTGWALRSPIKGTEWDKAVLRARCFYQDHSLYQMGMPTRTIVDQHKAPDHECGCGIYAYYEPNFVNLHSSWIMGLTPNFRFHVTAVITLTGTVEVHETGMRGERAIIRAIVRDPLHKDDLAQIALSYDVDLIDKEDVAQAALKYGSPLDESLRPKRKSTKENDDII